jgi:pyruvate dehydrogenase E2 component (dihydrolipoamide acetyltransferase)
LGGGIGLLIAAEQPERAASLSLIAPAGLGHGINREFLKAYPELTDPEATATLLRKLVHRPQLINKLTVQRVMAQLGREGVRQALKAIASALALHEAEFAGAAETVARLGLPRLTLWGELDAINPVNQDRLSAFGGAFHLVQEAGHLPHIENPKSVNEQLVSFLKHNMAP